MCHDDEMSDELVREVDVYQAYIDRLDDEVALDGLWIDHLVAYALAGF